MSPRTREQQDEYNRKRREENAARKALAAQVRDKPAPAPTVSAAKPAKGKGKARAAPSNGSNGAGHSPVRPAHRADNVKPLRTKGLKKIGEARTAPFVSEPHKKPDRVALSLAADKASRERHGEPPRAAIALSAKAPTIQAGAPREYTMTRSYVRTTGAGRGKLRAGTYQATVSFTPEQMAQLVEAAGFRCVSLAEMIRSCVVGHLNKQV